MNFDKPLLFRILRFLFVAVCLYVGTILTVFISTVTYPFIIALLIALLINPVVKAMESKLRIPRAFAVFITMILVFIIMAGILTLLVAEIISGTNYLARVVPTHFQTLVMYLEQFFAAQIIPFYNRISLMFDTLDLGQQANIMNNIQSVGTTIALSISNSLEKILKSIPNILGVLPNLATVFVFSLLATFFISKDWYQFHRFFEKYFPSKVRTSSRFVVTDLKKAFAGFIQAQFTLISMTALLVLIGLIVLKVKYAITIALIIGFVDLLPYLGTGIVFVPWIVYLFFTNQVSLAIGLTILYVVVIVARQVMEPKILSSNIGLDPLATLFALFVGYKLFGFLGLIIGPVALVVLKTLHQAGIFRDIWGFIVGKEV